MASEVQLNERELPYLKVLVVPGRLLVILGPATIVNQ